MKVLVTGAAGLIGSNLVRRFCNEGHVVVAVDDLSNGYRDNLDSRAYFASVDCTDYARVHSLFFAHAPFDVIYHCAAYPHEGLSVFSPWAVTRSILDATMAVASCAIKFGTRRFVNFSSMATYGEGTPPFREEDPLVPSDPYGNAKVAAEHALESLCAVHEMEFVTAVPHNVIGVGQVYTDPFRNVAAIMLNRVLQGNPPVIYGDGEQTRCFSFVEDCVDVLVKMATYQDFIGYRFNIGPDDKDKGHLVTVNQLARLVQDIAGTSMDPVHVPARPREVKHAYCSSDRVRQVFGYETKVSLEEGLLRMRDWIKKRGPKPFDYSRIGLEIISDKTPTTWKDRLL